jgi:hypothetical protein
MMKVNEAPCNKDSRQIHIKGIIYVVMEDVEGF